MHPYLKTDKKTADKICTSCGRVIYSGKKSQNDRFFNQQQMPV